MQRILLAEDSSRIASFVIKGLTASGYKIDHVADGDKVLPSLKSAKYDLMILDIGLPNREGLSILEELRGTGNDIPVIILTARDSVETTVASFKSGADDYMSKPFSFEELLARVKTRIRTKSAGNPVEASNAVLTKGNISLDLVSRRVKVGPNEYELTAREFMMLELLMKNPSQVISREQLLDRVWGLDHDPGSNVVDVYIRYLRQKLGAGTITTVRGSGYKLS
jgi:DNA-binding response OmpR family regulator